MSRTIKSKKVPDELKGYPLFEDYDEALKATKPDAVSIRFCARPMPARCSAG